MTFLHVVFFPLARLVSLVLLSLIWKSVGECRRPVKSACPSVCRVPCVRQTACAGDFLLHGATSVVLPATASSGEKQPRQTVCAVMISHCLAAHCARRGGRFGVWAGVAILRNENNRVPPPFYPIPVTLQTPQGGTSSTPAGWPKQCGFFFFPRARLSSCCFSGKLICHWPDTQLLDPCLKTFKTLWREVIHWIRKPVGGRKKNNHKKILGAGAQESIKLHFCGSDASSVTWPVSLDPSCEVLVYFQEKKMHFNFRV